MDSIEAKGRRAIRSAPPTRSVESESDFANRARGNGAVRDESEPSAHAVSHPTGWTRSSSSRIGRWFGAAELGTGLAAAALALAIVAAQAVAGTGGRVALGRELHGVHFRARGERIAKLFPVTRLARESLQYHANVVGGGTILLVGVATRRAAPVVVAAASAYTAQFLLFWWAARRVPPSVLVLGTSAPAFGDLIHALRAAYQPHRIVLLLDLTEPTPWYDSDRLDNFRTTRDDAWKSVFQVLLDAAALERLAARQRSG